ncbi:MAG: nitroreductase/quinone reductase family protein [Gammaproteobacteria bacterium]|nr:nitroreductase/quinone reductase family protein [Gammaproteobacteria bacterium]
MSYPITAVIVVGIYFGLVILAEGLIGYFQPDMDGAIRLATADSEGQLSERTLAGFHHNDRLYVASNHWFRGWYNRALKNPTVKATVEGTAGSYTAVPVQGAELDELAEAYRMGFVLRMVCGFAPSRFLRLDPIQ